MAPTLVLSAEETNLEKIPSPDQIKHFKVMKKKGHTLYGIRLKSQANNQPSLSADVSETNTNKKSSVLEKISGPWDIKLFNKIKRIGNALWGHRKEIKKEERLGHGELTTEIITCLKNAIDKKDEVIKSTITTASDELVLAVSDRNTCQKAALDLSTNEERIKAFKICKENFNTTVKESRDKAKMARNEAWKTYKIDIKACYGLSQVNDVDDSSDEDVLLEDGGENLDL